MAGIVHGGLLRTGTLPQSAGDAAFQTFLADLLSKKNGGTVNGQVLFQTPGAGLTIGSGAGLTIGSGSGFNISAGALARFDNAVELTAAPALPAHLVNKQYVDSAIANSANGRNWVAAARVMSNRNVPLINTPTAVDGVTLAAGDRVLLVGQAPPKENGVYVYNGTGLVRADDANSAAEMVNLTIWVSEGTARADVQYTCTANKSLVLDTDPVNFVQTGGAGMMLAGWGVDIAGNTVSVKYAAPVAPTIGATNGTNTTFTFFGVKFAGGGERVEVDGVRVYVGADYSASATVSETVVSFVAPPPAGSRVMLSGFLA